MYRQAVLVAFLVTFALAQQPGILTKETHPPLNFQSCDAHGCNPQDALVVIDANWRWLHNNASKNCFTGKSWDKTICPDPDTCASRCYLEGAADYNKSYGVSTSDNALTLQFVTQGQTKNVGSRVYLLNNETEYSLFGLLNQEFTFDVDVSKLPCGLNGALYFSEMSPDGGMSAYPGNKAGAAYGTGYCDAQCPKDIKFIDGKANFGQYGNCCNELDIWEANSMASAFTTHVCRDEGPESCQGLDCNTSCDQAGCDFNSYRMGNHSFYGPGKIVDTTQPFTVVTQFITKDSSFEGTLTEIRRKYVQNGVVIQNSNVAIPGIDPVNSISDNFCSQQKTVTNSLDVQSQIGGLAEMGAALSRGMVLTFSIWDDPGSSMLWLDSTYPAGNSSQPGAARGACPTTTGNASSVEQQYPNAAVVFSNIRSGDIGSTLLDANISDGTANNANNGNSIANNAGASDGGVGQRRALSDHANNAGGSSATKRGDLRQSNKYGPVGRMAAPKKDSDASSNGPISEDYGVQWY